MALQRNPARAEPTPGRSMKTCPEKVGADTYVIAEILSGAGLPSRLTATQQCDGFSLA
jgi:hypothetical protein